MLLPRTFLAALAVVVCTVAGVWLVAVVREHAPPPDAGAPSAAVRSSGPREALRQWDVRRAEAWATGDAGALRSLYAPGSRAGDRDVSMLRRYADRGLRVRLRTQVLAVDVVSETETRVVVVATERLASAVAVRGGRRVALPHDGPSTRRITLTRVGAGQWRVASVEPVSADPSPARP